MQQDFHLGNWLVQPKLCRLTVDGRTVQVRAKVMDLLVCLARYPGEVVGKDRLLDEVWKSHAISESALTRTVTELRQALEDDAGQPRMLETIPKRGYRLIAPVIPVQALSPGSTPQRETSGVRVPAILAIATAVIVILVTVAFRVADSGASLLTGRDRPAPLPFAARDWVLVAAFDNRTGDPAFDDVLEHALSRELAGSGFVNAVPRPRVEDVLALMRKPADQRLDASLAREVALRDGGIRAVLTGSIRKVGSAYVLTTEIVDPANAAVVAHLSDDVPAPAELLPRVRAQALRVRQTLGEALSSIDRSRAALQKVTTPSLEALQLYSKAAALLEGDSWRPRPEAMRHYGSAEALLRKAVEVDPSFASAWLLLAHAVGGQQHPGHAGLPHAERALALSGSVPPVERYLIEGFTHRIRDDWQQPDRSESEAAARAYEALLQLAPDHYWALVELGWVYRSLNRIDDADRVTLDAFRVRPHSPRFAVNAAQVHVNRRDMTAAHTIISRVLAANPGPEDRAVDAFDALGWARLWEAHDAWLKNDVKRALEAARAAELKWIDSTSLVFHSQLKAVYAGLGRFDDAMRVINRIEPRDRREWFQALNAANRQRWDKLRELLKPERKDFDLLTSHLGILIIAGWVPEAEWVVNERRRRNMRPPTWYAHADQEGQLLAAQGRYAEAVALMEPLKTVGGNRYYVDDAMAVSRRGIGDLPGAIRELERAGQGRTLAVTGDGWQVHAWLRCRVRLAELYREAGRQTEADQVFNEVRTLLAVADADHPLLPRLPAPR